MRPISIRELRWLLERHAAPCVSVYLPGGRQLNPSEDRRRFEALVDRAAALLVEGSTTDAEAAELLAPLRELSQARFWSGRKDALAVFRSADVFTHYRIPATVPELAVVADTFHTRPLVRYLNSSRRHFYVLVLAPGEVRLLEGSPERLAAVEAEDLPPDVRDAIADEAGRAFLTAEADGASGGELPRGASRRGNGAGHAALTRYFAALDAALWAWLEDDLAPLVLAGAPRHQEAYRAASRYPELLEDGLDLGAEEDADGAELHLRALRLIREHDADVLGAVLAQLSSALSSGDADTDLGAIARAAVEGRVRLLVFTADAQQWGRLDRRTGAIALADRQRDDVDADVVDDLCEVVLLAGGDVHEVPAGALPAPVAAIYR